MDRRVDRLNVLIGSGNIVRGPVTSGCISVRVIDTEERKEICGGYCEHGPYTLKLTHGGDDLTKDEKKLIFKRVKNAMLSRRSEYGYL